MRRLNPRSARWRTLLKSRNSFYYAQKKHFFVEIAVDSFYYYYKGEESGETHLQRSHIRRLSLILNVSESESICSDFSPEKLVICVGGAALGAEWRWVARNKPMSGLLFFNNFHNFKISRWRFVQMPIKLFLWWRWFKLQYFLPHLSLSRLFFICLSHEMYITKFIVQIWKLNPSQKSRISKFFILIR